MVIAPRPFGQVLNDSISGLAQVWRALLGPAMLASVPASLGTVLAFLATDSTDFVELVLNNPDGLQRLPSQVFDELVRSFYLAVAVSLLLQITAGVFIALLSHRAVAADLGGRPLSPGEATRQAIRRYPNALVAVIIVVTVAVALIGAGLVVWLTPLLTVGVPNIASLLVALLLFLALLGPGIWVGVSVSMTTPALAIEDGGPLASIRRSFTLVRGRWWSTAGFLLLVGLLGGIAVQLIQLVALPLAVVGDADTGTAFVIAAVLGVLTQGVLIAAIAAMYTHWYIDLRSRRETLSTEDLG